MPEPVAVHHLALQLAARLHHLLREGDEVEQMQIARPLERPSDVRGAQAEEPRGAGREPAHGQIVAQEHDRDVDRAEQVQQVVADLGQLGIALVELLVERGQLLVARLQLLLGRLELLVEALQLLVARQDLLVRELERAVGGALLLGDRTQVVAHRRELLLEQEDLVVPRLPARATRQGRGPALRPLGVEEDQEAGLAGEGAADRQDLQVDLENTVVVPELDLLAPHRGARRLCLLDHPAQAGQQPFLRHLRQAQARVP
ncbi:MAG TPA: hypothetical protein VGE98_17215 [Thermoanaerobaculia bacterium]